MFPIFTQYHIHTTDTSTVPLSLSCSASLQTMANITHQCQYSALPTNS